MDEASARFLNLKQRRLVWLSTVGGLGDQGGGYWGRGVVTEDLGIRGSGGLENWVTAAHTMHANPLRGHHSV